MLVLLTTWLVFTAGCAATTQLTDEPTRNATLSGASLIDDASPVTTRAFWDRSSNWEDPRPRNATITSRTRTYDDGRGTDAVVVYTTPKKPYVKADRPRSMSPPQRARLATAAADVPAVGANSRPVATASLLGQRVTVHALSGPAAPGAAAVASVATSDAVIIVVVFGTTDIETVRRVLTAVQV